jgi:hypothetical protein
MTAVACDLDYVLIRGTFAVIAAILSIVIYGTTAGPMSTFIIIRHLFYPRSIRFCLATIGQL